MTEPMPESGTDLPVDTVEFAAPNATLGGSFAVLGTAVAGFSGCSP